MSRLERRTTAEMTEEQAELFAKMANGRTPQGDGHIGGPFDAWITSPKTGRRISALGQALRFESSLDRRHIEIAILVTGQLWQAQFEWFAHEPMAREAGVPEALIAAIKSGDEPSSFETTADESCYRVARMIHADHKLDDATYANALEHFGEAGIADIFNTCGFYVLVCMTLNGFDVELPEGAEYPFPRRFGS